MTDQMTRLQQEAEERYPDIPGAPENTTLIVNMRAAFIAGRTISKDQVKKFEAELNWSGNLRYAFEAAGLVLEE